MTAAVAAGPAAIYGWIIGGVCVCILALVHAELGAMIFDKQRPRLQWRSAQWVWPYLIGMGVISWMGQFGSGAPPVNTGRIPFWWDMLAVAVFSLVIFYWAQRTKLPAEEMQALVEQQAERMGTVPPATGTPAAPDATAGPYAQGGYGQEQPYIA